jgi:hypothetical protein
MIRLIALALALALAQPASAQPAPPPAAAAVPAAKPAIRTSAVARRGPCIGVIPMLGASFVVQRIGLTVFGNARKPFPVDTWGLDDLAVARVRAAAGSRYAVRRLAFAQSDFDPL